MERPGITIEGEFAVKTTSLLAVLILAAPAMAQTAPPAIQAAVASPDRPEADTARDANRHPAALLAFAGVRPGDSVADFMPGTGYFTRILSHAVGKQGHVYAITPSELATVMPKLPSAIEALAKQPAYGNVTPLVQPTAHTGQGERFDVVWTDDNYHDMYGFFGAKSAAPAEAWIFASLTPGGVCGVIDHVGLPGSSDTAPTTLHRIDPATVKAQVMAAGFVLEAQSDLLRNPADSHTEKVFAPDIKGHTDQFVFKFRKPTV